MDAELCILSLCQPELSLDANSLNARLSRLEEQLKSGTVTVTVSEPDPVPQLPDVTVQEDVQQEPCAQIPEQTQEPIGFWTDVVSAVRKELKPPACGFFTTTPNAPVKGILCGSQVILQCSNGFALEMVNKPEILSLVARKASAILGRQVTAKAQDPSAGVSKNEKMESLLNFGKEHPDIIKIKNN